MKNVLPPERNRCICASLADPATPVRRRLRPRGEQGIAIVLVLCFLVLITGLVIAFFTSITTENASTNSYANGVGSRELADSTVQVVLGTIKTATSQGSGTAWASQPGMIRTYGSDDKALNNFKLYSSDAMVVAKPVAFDPGGDFDPAWAAKPALFTDLNSPIISGGKTVFPIIDGNSMSTLSKTATGTDAPAQYLGYDSDGNGLPDVEGFGVDPGKVSYNATQALSPTNTPVPMPVKWIYVLRDGTLSAPSGVSLTDGKTAQWTTAPVGLQPSAANPIVGRIAFWTDDETAKVNLNTASEGNFVDTPRAQGVTDYAMARFPPAQHEYQRYPGHPATTSLSTIFGSLYPVDHNARSTIPGYAGYSSPDRPKYSDYQPYYDLAPRSNIDQPNNLNLDPANNLGSQAGTVQPPGTLVNNVYTGTPLKVKADRLYASLSELVFAPPLYNATSGAPRVVTNSQTSAKGLDPATVERAKFFATTNSRAPDVNLFGLPRVVCWPITTPPPPPADQDITHYRTPFDQAIAFCGTINGTVGGAPTALPYYFQRSRNDHPTIDLPTVPDGSTLYRNRDLMTYLQRLTSTDVPGFGGNFGDKYPANSLTGVVERDQILTEIFDYIRCLNLYDTSTPTMIHPFAPVDARYQFHFGDGRPGDGSPPARDDLTYLAGWGQVVPIYDAATKTKGFGRFPTISEVSLVFVATGWNDGMGGRLTDDAGHTSTDPNYISTIPLDADQHTTTRLSDDNPPQMTYPPWGFYNNDTTKPIYGKKTTPSSPFGTAPSGVSALSMKPIPPGNVQVQAMLLLSFFDPSQGNVPEFGTYSVQVKGLDGLKWGSDLNTLPPGAVATAITPMGFASAASTNTSNPIRSTGGGTSNMASSRDMQYMVHWGGNMGFRNFVAAEYPQNDVSSASNSYLIPFTNVARSFPYDPAKPVTNFDFFGSKSPITIRILLPSSTPNWPAASWPLTNPDTLSRPPLQTITIIFPDAILPLPTYPQPARDPNGRIKADGVTPIYVDRANLQYRFVNGTDAHGPNCEFTAHGSTIYNGDTIRSVRAYPGDIRMIAGSVSVSDTAPPPGYFDSTETKINADMPQWDYFNSGLFQVHSLRDSCDAPYFGATLGKLVAAANYSGEPDPGQTRGDYPTYGFGDFSGAGNNPTSKGAFIGGGTTGLPGDWDNGFGFTADGPYINKADEGNTNFGGVDITPYFNGADYTPTYSGSAVFSPNRLMPSPVMFGSLSTGVARNIPWQTLLFCPNPAAGKAHPGFGKDLATVVGPALQPPLNLPPDHLLLDLFNMPVVEPYPITEPLSTAGRINMNYQIVPFNYITRNTGLRAVMKAERLTVIPTSDGGQYKVGGNTDFRLPSSPHYSDYRVPINLDETLRGFDNYFTSHKDIFRSATQICDMFLYPATDAYPLPNPPAGPSYDIDGSDTAITKFWADHALTGDNSRERPYATIYPRLTTKSNTYTVHMRVQVLKKVVSTSPAVWTEGKDVVLSEYRGSSTVERYVDPNDATLPDFATLPVGPDADTLENHYKFRVISNTAFSR